MNKLEPTWPVWRIIFSDIPGSYGQSTQEMIAPPSLANVSIPAAPLSWLTAHDHRHHSFALLIKMKTKFFSVVIWNGEFNRGCVIFIIHKISSGIHEDWVTEGARGWGEWLCRKLSPAYSFPLMNSCSSTGRWWGNVPAEHNGCTSLHSCAADVPLGGSLVLPICMGSSVDVGRGSTGLGGGHHQEAEELPACCHCLWKTRFVSPGSGKQNNVVQRFDYFFPAVIIWTEHDSEFVCGTPCC